ncbi:hypothetical protein NHQ30_001422 [Ciborinia camelliae]|nr:hypothetical protein NHQ30_001422 [Ciborinia camelliae]
MGQAISSAIKAVTGDSKDDSKTRDTLNALYALGKSRSDFIIAKVNSGAESNYAPVSKVLYQKQKIVCNTKTDTTDIVSGIKDGIGNLIGGQILDGVTNIVAEGLKAILGESAGQIATETTYALVATELAALLRIDVDTYNFQTTTAIGLQNTINNVTAVTMVISSVDVQSMTLNDLRAVVSLKYSSSTEAKQQQILQALIAAFTQEKKGTSGNLTGDALLEYQKVFVPSIYEAALAQRLKEGPMLENISDNGLAQKASLSSLERQLRAQLSVRSSIPNGNDYIDGYHSGSLENLPPGDDAPLSEHSISLVIPISGLEHRHDWASLMSGLMTAFIPLDGLIKFRGAPTKIHGTSVSFDFSVDGSAEQFDVAIMFFERVLIPKLGQCGQLVRDCKSFLLEYSRPQAITSIASFPRPFKLGTMNNTNGGYEPSDLTQSQTERDWKLQRRIRQYDAPLPKSSIIAFDQATVLNLVGRACWFFDESGNALLRFSETDKDGQLSGAVSYLSPNGTTKYKTNQKIQGPPRGAQILLGATGTGNFPTTFTLEWEEGEGRKVRLVYNNPS